MGVRVPSRTKRIQVVSVKDRVSQANAILTYEGHGEVMRSGQALAGVMKPNLIRALIQRGALR